MLFVFDDIWNEEFYKYLRFAKKSVATSRFNHAPYHYTRIAAKVSGLL